MAAKKPLPIVDPEAEPITETAPEAIRIVTLDEAVNTSPEAGTAYWIGEKGVIPFEDGSQFVVQQHLCTVTDPETIKKLDQMAKFPGNPYKILKQ